MCRPSLAVHDSDRRGARYTGSHCTGIDRPKPALGCRRPPRSHDLRKRPGRTGADIGLVEAALLRAATGPSDDVAQAASLTWEAEQLLDYLERAGTAIEARARLEFLLMPLLQHTRPARATR